MFYSIQTYFLSLMFFLFPNFLLFANTCNDPFSEISLCSSERYLEALQKKTLDMSWYFGENSYLHFIAGKEEVYFEICLEKLDHSTQHFIEQVKASSFHQIPEKENWVYSYRCKMDGSEEINVPQINEDKIILFMIDGSWLMHIPSN